MEILNAPIIEKVYVYLRISGSSPQVVVFSLLLMIPDAEILHRDSFEGSSGYLSKTEDKGNNRQPSQCDNVYLEKYAFQ